MATEQERPRVVNQSPPFQEKSILGCEKRRTAALARNADNDTPKAMLAQQSRHRHYPRRGRGTPGLPASSKGSEDIFQRKRLALSPVTKPGATTFSSVASAFDFQHHLGSDPASELLVLKRILARESLLSRLEDVCDLLRKRPQHPAVQLDGGGGTTAPSEGAGVVVGLLSSMRDATVAVIEAVTIWRKDMIGHPPSAFVWHGDNYLLKITNDLNFLAGVQTLVDTLKMHPARFCRNPLMLPQTLDEQRRDGELHEAGPNNSSPRLRKRRHLYQVAQVLLDEEGLESQRDCLRREASRAAASALPGRGDTSPELNRRDDGQSQDDRLGIGNAGHGGRLRTSTAESLRNAAPHTEGGLSASFSHSGSAGGRDLTEEEDTFQRRHQLSTWYAEARSQLVSLSTSPADEEYFLRSRRFWSEKELGVAGACGELSPPPPLRRRRSLGTRGGPNADGTGTGGSEQDARSRRSKGVYVNRLDPGGSGQLMNGGGGGYGGSGRSLRGDGFDPQEPRVDRFGPGALNHRGGSTPRPSRHLEDLRAVSVGEVGGSGEGALEGRDGEDRGHVDVWRRSDHFGGGNSAALSCLTADDIEQLLREQHPSPATTAVCTAILILLAPEDQPPEDFCWPQGFGSVALPAEPFLWKLYEASGSTGNPFKAHVLRFVLQKKEFLPAEIERRGEHAVAGLCAWALEELRGYEAFAEWSASALEPWYEMQLTSPKADLPESTDGMEPGATLVYKALHILPRVGGSYVLSLFEDSNADGGLILRGFDRANREAFWVPLPRKKLASFDANETRSPAHMAMALSFRLKMKVDSASGLRRLFLPPTRSAEYDKRNRRGVTKRARVASGVDDTAGAGEATSALLPPLQAAAAEETAEAMPQPSAKGLPPRRKSYPPRTKGSTADGLSPLVERDRDNEEDSTGGARRTPLVSSAVDAEGGASDAARVGQGLEPRRRSEEEALNRSYPQEEKTASGASSVETTDEHGGDATASAANVTSVAAWSETFDKPKFEADKVEGNDEGHLLKAGEALEESESYADDFGEGAECEGDEMEPGHDGSGSETLFEQALAGADPSLKASDHGAGAAGPEELLAAAVVGEGGAGGLEDVGAKDSSADTVDTLSKVATSSKSAETAVRPPWDGRGVSAVEGGMDGGSKHHGTGDVAGTHEGEKDVVEAVKEHAEKEGSVNSESALSRPSSSSKTADLRAPAHDSVEIDDATALCQTRETYHHPFVRNSSGTTGETPDQTIDDDSSGYIADGGFGEETGSKVPSVGDELKVPSVDDELEVPESPLEEMEADVKGPPCQDDPSQEPGSVVMDGEGIGEEASEAYMSDFDDAPAESLEENSGAVVATKVTERVVQPASGGGGAVAVPAEGGSQAGSSVATEDEGVLGLEPAHTEDSSPTEEYPSDIDDSSEVDYGEDIESTDVDASSKATAMTAEADANSVLASGENQVQSNLAVSMNGTNNDKTQGGTASVKSSDLSTPNNRNKLHSGEPKEEGDPESARNRDESVHSVSDVQSVSREEKTAAESTYSHANPVNSTAFAKGVPSAVAEGSGIGSTEEKAQSTIAAVTAPVGEAIEVDVRVDKGNGVSVVSKGKVVPTGVDARLDRRKSSSEDFEQDFEDDFEEDVPSTQPQELRHDDRVGVDVKVEAGKDGSVSAEGSGEPNDTSGNTSACREEGVNGSADEKSPPQVAAEESEAPRVDEEKTVPQLSEADEKRSDEPQRECSDVAAAAHSDESGNEFEDDFEDDFEDP